MRRRRAVVGDLSTPCQHRECPGNRPAKSTTGRSRGSNFISPPPPPPPTHSFKPTSPTHPKSTFENRPSVYFYGTCPCGRRGRGKPESDQADLFIRRYGTGHRINRNVRLFVDCSPFDPSCAAIDGDPSIKLIASFLRVVLGFHVDLVSRTGRFPITELLQRNVLTEVLLGFTGLGQQRTRGLAVFHRLACYLRPVSRRPSSVASYFRWPSVGHVVAVRARFVFRSFFFFLQLLLLLLFVVVLVFDFTIQTASNRIRSIDSTRWSPLVADVPEYRYGCFVDRTGFYRVFFPLEWCRSG